MNLINPDQNNGVIDCACFSDLLSIAIYSSTDIVANYTVFVALVSVSL